MGLARDGFNLVINGSLDRAAAEAVAAEAVAFGARALLAMGDVVLPTDCAAIAQHPYYPGRLCLRGAFQPIGEGLACVGHEIRRGPDWLGPDWLGRAGGVCLIDSDGSTGFDRGGADPRRAAAYAVGS